MNRPIFSILALPNFPVSRSFIRLGWGVVEHCQDGGSPWLIQQRALEMQTPTAPPILVIETGLQWLSLVYGARIATNLFNFCGPHLCQSYRRNDKTISSQCDRHINPLHANSDQRISSSRACPTIMSPQLKFLPHVSATKENSESRSTLSISIVVFPSISLGFGDFLPAYTQPLPLLHFSVQYPMRGNPNPMDYHPLRSPEPERPYWHHFLKKDAPIYQSGQVLRVSFWLDSPLGWRPVGTRDWMIMPEHTVRSVRTFTVFRPKANCALIEADRQQHRGSPKTRRERQLWSCTGRWRKFRRENPRAEWRWQRRTHWVWRARKVPYILAFLQRPEESGRS